MKHVGTAGVSYFPKEGGCIQPAFWEQTQLLLSPKLCPGLAWERGGSCARSKLEITQFKPDFQLCATFSLMVEL